MNISHRQEDQFVYGRKHFIKEDCIDIIVGINNTRLCKYL